MSTNRTPSLRRHKGSSQAVVTLNGRDHYLGPWPAHLRKPPTSVRQAYDRLIAEWLGGGRQVPSGAQDLTVAEVIARLWSQIEEHYRKPDGTTTTEPGEYKAAFRPLVHLYGNLPAAELGPLKLKAVRQLMIEGYQHPKYGPQEALSRKLINKRVSRIVRLFKWAVAEELVPAEAYQGLRAVQGLQRGRTEARETAPVKPVPDSWVDAVLPHVSAEIAAMIQLQRLTGMRPGEVCIMRACDIDTTGSVWLYRPASHKTEHHGHKRVIAIGPKGQEIIKAFLQLDTQAFLFSPARAMERYRAKLRADRKTPMTPSQARRKPKSRPKRAPGDHYTTMTYDQAVLDACDRAHPPAEPLARRQGESRKQWLSRLTVEEKQALSAWQQEHRWHPNQLRHAHATEVRKAFGLEASQVALGHSQADVTQVYAERDEALAVKVASAIG